MKYKKDIRILIVSTLCLFEVSLFAQQSTSFKNTTSYPLAKIHPLKVGDVLPDFTFKRILNYKSDKARLSNFKKKLIILDFWNTFCTSCIASFPKIDKLQSEFDKDIQILLVNPHAGKYDTEEKIKATLARNKQRTGFSPSLPIPILDSTLNEYFPHNSVPHYVWLDSNRKVVAITGSVPVIGDNIKLFIEGGNLNLHTKDDWSFKKNLPLLLDNNGGNASDYLYGTTITKYIDGIGYESGYKFTKEGDIKGFYYLNNNVWNLITIGYRDIFNGGFQLNRIIIDSDNPKKYEPRRFEVDNTHCYEVSFPPIKQSQFDYSSYLKKQSDFIKNDLKQFFNISVAKEKRVMQCLVVTNTNVLEKNYSNRSDSTYEFEKENIQNYFHNKSASFVLTMLGDYFAQPIIDETNVLRNIDIDYPPHLDITNQSKVIQFLETKGFVFKEESREIEVVVISDK